MDRDVADRRGAVGLEHRLERRAVVLGLEDAADRVAEVDDARIALARPRCRRCGRPCSPARSSGSGSCASSGSVDWLMSGGLRNGRLGAQCGREQSGERERKRIAGKRAWTTAHIDVVFRRQLETKVRSRTRLSAQPIVETSENTKVAVAGLRELHPRYTSAGDVHATSPQHLDCSSP